MSIKILFTSLLTLALFTAGHAQTLDNAQRVITHTDNPLFLWYVAGWTGFCLLAALIVAHDHVEVWPEVRRYWAYLTMRWKLAFFVPAVLFITFAGRFTDDETWDVVSGGGMSVLTFLSAPWCLGLIYQVFTGRRQRRYLVVAAALLLFSSSWFYDGYLFLRDGSYTTRWWSNLLLSPVIYLAAGFLWNLEARGRFGVRLGFVRDDWPTRPADGGLLPLLLVSIPLILIAGFVLIAFVQWRMPWLEK